MGGRSATRVARIAALVALGLVPALACTPRDPRPNVVVVTFDTTRADALSCLGGRPGTTPHLDALAARSALFARAYSDSNVTNPSHVSIMTGLRAIDHGVMNHYTPIPEPDETLSEVFQKAGYRTGGFVSSRHVGRDLGWQGFDEMPPVRGAQGSKQTTDLALEWLGKRSSKPFFLWVHYWDPHMQYEPPAELAAQYYRGDRTAGGAPRLADRPYFRLVPRDGVIEWLGDTRDPAWAPAMYAAEVHYTDEQLGRLLDGIAQHGGENTLVVVTADHGESLGEHEIYYAHTGLYEQQLHVPLIVHWPGAPALESEVLASSLDIAPTIAELAGVQLSDKRLAGRSLARIVRGQADEAAAAPRALIHQNAHNLAVSVREGEWKAIFPLGGGHPLFSGDPELYHLVDDPGETKDLAAREPQRLAAMRKAAEPWFALGPESRDKVPNLDPEALERLRALGYLQD